ncbi:hypothetical protein [Fodinicola feengrottensis]|uniref:hypothetical protein n=1 Tax=Fodinicola feengrottensis TaxID=435914 RepID=UPI0013D368C7|nr:hypothetical protein [Fodinicola feengrottensis]
MVEEEQILLALSVDDARNLMDAIHLLGEHVAAGAPIPELDEDFDRSVGGIYQHLISELQKLGRLRR